MARIDEAATLMQVADAAGCHEAGGLACTAMNELSYAAEIDKARGRGSSKAWGLRSSARRNMAKARKIFDAWKVANLP